MSERKKRIPKRLKPYTLTESGDGKATDYREIGFSAWVVQADLFSHLIEQPDARNQEQHRGRSTVEHPCHPEMG